ncbi:Panacea domain-containing protein [Sphingobium sp. ZW T5_29]|uniref:Panacea domain-containing protein n=1 Tax=Sphingobium sp. ZW T5_29 TaxID=3378077 RepID=UPI003852A7F0
MSYDARQIANWFIKRAANDGRVLSIMSLLKLAYIAHGWHLEMRGGKPLFDNRIEAWQYGPVIPDVYNEFRPQGVSASDISPAYQAPLDASTEDLLEQIYKIYGRMSPFQLSELTHVAGGPWETARKWGGWYAEIPDEVILSHYVAKRQQSANSQHG